MERLHSPWRSKYIQSFSNPGTEGEECVLCQASRQDKDDDMLVVTRGQHCYVVMNRFPYNSGHVMIVPYRHSSSLLDIGEDELLEIVHLQQKMVATLMRVLHPDGFNIGANLGRIAGAGIDQHIHFHIVPRWNGDTNFMPVLAETKIISEDIVTTMMKLRQAL